MKIVVIGGTGRIGTRVVAMLREWGHEAVAAAPGTGVDTITGAGLPDALQQAAAVIDVTDAPSYEDAAALAFFETSSRNLVRAEVAAGVGHHVVLSVVGTDRLLESGDFRAKLAQEHVVARSGVPFTIVRAAQFFEFVERIAQAATDGDVVRVRPVFFQPAAIADVAGALGSAALSPPRNGTVEFAGPELFRLDELIRVVLAAHGVQRDVRADPEAPYFGAHPLELSLVPGDGAELGATRFQDWLARLPDPARAADPVSST